MSAKTKVVVLHMKELIYTLIFAGLGILLIFCCQFVATSKQAWHKCFTIVILKRLHHFWKEDIHNTGSC